LKYNKPQISVLITILSLWSGLLITEGKNNPVGNLLLGVEFFAMFSHSLIKAMVYVVASMYLGDLHRSWLCFYIQKNDLKKSIIGVGGRG
jgi:hypothetical protein